MAIIKGGCYMFSLSEEIIIKGEQNSSQNISKVRMNDRNLKKPTKPIFCFRRSLGHRNRCLRYAIDISALLKDRARKHKWRIERRMFYGTRPFSVECDFSCVQQIARTDRFACVLTRACAIGHVKRKGL